MTEQDNPAGSDSVTQLQRQFAEALANRSVSTLVEFIEPLNVELGVEEMVKLISIEMEFRRSLGELISLRDFYGDFPAIAEADNDQTVTRALDQSTALITAVFADEPTEESRRLINPGDKIDDFELLAELGKGSFATVFLARQTSMQRLVALKVSVDHGMEAQTLAQLDHPNIVRVYDQRKAVDYDLQLLYMQYLEGGTLLDAAQWLFNRPGEIELSGKSLVRAIDQAMVDRGAAPNYESPFRKQLVEANWDQAIFLMGHALAQALDYAHGRGVLHRDIKPANVLIGGDCTMKLADFNISSATTVVGTGKFGGSLAYMSPEQIRAFNPADEFTADQLDERCDIYSLGVMLIQLLKGSLPFSNYSRSRSTAGLENMIEERRSPVSLQRIADSLADHSPLLQTTLLNCIAPAADDRHASAADLATQLKIGLDPAAEQLLFPARNSWSKRLRGWFYPICFVVALILNALAAAFITTFHIYESVDDEFHVTYMTVQRIVNGIAFPLAAMIFVALTHVVHQVLKSRRRSQPVNGDDQILAISRNLAAGHIQAAVCGFEWIAAGVLYPLVLTCLGVRLDAPGWINFIASHTLAGVAITTLTFFAISWFSVTSWLPAILQGSYTSESVAATTKGLNRLLDRIPIYQVLAASIPLLAIALLVIFSELVEQSKFSLTVVSIFGLFVIPLVMVGGNKIRNVSEKLMTVLRS